MTYNNLIQLFRDFAENHHMVKSFVENQVSDLTNDDTNLYPQMAVFYDQSTYGEKTETYGLTVYILDLPLTKQDEVKVEQQIISDCKQIAEDIVADIRNGFKIFVFDDNVIVQSSAIVPLIDTTTQMLTGVSMSLSIQIPFLANACDAPLIGVTPTPAGECLPATYRNSNGSFSQDINSGATYTAPDIVLTQADGSTSLVVPNIALACVFPSLALKNSDDTTIGQVSSYPVDGEVDVVDTTVNNSDASTTLSVPSGSDYITPDITLTEVDGSSSSVPSLKDLVCAWANIRVNNTVGTGLLAINSYPVGGVATLPDTLVAVKNSDGTTIEANVDYEHNDVIELSDAEVEDSAGASFDRPICSSILLPDTTINSVTVVGNLMTINTPTAVTPSGIHYQDTSPAFNASFVTGDSWDNFQNGNYNRTPPTYPEAFAMLKYNATQADVRATPATGTSGTDAVSPTILEENNAFGNKFRYTDDAGNPSDASVGSNLWAHVDWNNHSWTGATSYYVIDHLTGFGFTVKYEDDSGKVNLSTSGNNWADWMAYIDGTHYGYTGWMPLDLGDVNNAHGARVQPNMVWADEFFEFDSSVSGSARGGFITGESYASTIFYHLYDSGNPDMVLDLTKAKDNGFQSRLTNCFMKRKHY